MTLPILLKGLKRVEKAKKSNATDELRQFFIRSTTKLLTTATSDHDTIMEILLGFCDTDLLKLEYIFTYCKFSTSQSQLKTLYLDPMSNQTKSTLEWKATNIKLTKPSLNKNELKELEAKSNDISKNKLNMLVKSNSDASLEFTESVFVYIKFIIIKSMVSENKHDIAI